MLPVRWIRARHQRAAERVVLTAIRSDRGPDELCELLLGADTQRVYSATGHPFESANKALELCDTLGWRRAEAIVPLVIPPMCEARGAEEAAHWRQAWPVSQYSLAIPAIPPQL